MFGATLASDDSDNDDGRLMMDLLWNKMGVKDNDEMMKLMMTIMVLTS